MPVNSTDPRAEQRDRIYAADLLNRAGIAFDARDLAVVAKLIPLLEDDVARWLARSLRIAVSRELTVAAVREGQHRPSYELRNEDGSVASRHDGDGSIRAGVGR